MYLQFLWLLNNLFFFKFHRYSNVSFLLIYLTKKKKMSFFFISDTSNSADERHICDRNFLWPHGQILCEEMVMWSDITLTPVKTAEYPSWQYPCWWNWSVTNGNPSTPKQQHAQIETSVWFSLKWLGISTRALRTH